jgi:hypothetical protein
MVDEAELEELLHGIERDAREELAAAAAAPEPGPEGDRAWQVLGAVDAWASLASDATQRFYGRRDALPEVGTPFDKLAGYSPRVATRLRRFGDALHRALGVAAQTLGATSYSLAVTFPGGMSASVSWELMRGQAPQQRPANADEVQSIIQALTGPAPPPILIDERTRSVMLGDVVAP